jgi:hypothetical protein
MNINVYGGTAKGCESLCNSCRFSLCVQGFADSQEMVFCGGVPGAQVPVIIKWPVARCNMHIGNDFISKDQLEKSAVILDGTHNRVTGFKTD